MAIYHLSVRQISAGKGQSAVAKSDYITRSGRYENDKQEVLYKAQGYLPDWASNARDFWQAAEQGERANARLGTEIEIALPVELSLEQQKQLVTNFVKTHLKDQPSQFAIHKGKGTNPHAHIIFSERTRTADNNFPREQYFKRNGAKKNRKFNDINWLPEIREAWSKECNKALERAGEVARIDHRSLFKQSKELLEFAEEKALKNDFKASKDALEASKALNRPPKIKGYHLRPKRGLKRLKNVFVKKWVGTTRKNDLTEELERVAKVINDLFYNIMKNGNQKQQLQAVYGNETVENMEGRQRQEENHKLERQQTLEQERLALKAQNEQIRKERLAKQNKPAISKNKPKSKDKGFSR